MDRVLPGESLPGSLSLPDKRISQSTHGMVDSSILARLGKAPVRRTIHPRRRLGPIKPTADTATEERRPDRSSLMWSRPIPSPWHVYKQDLMKLNLQIVKFTANAMRWFNGAKLSVSVCERTRGTAHRRGTESMAARTPDVNLDHARELGRTNELDPLPQTYEVDCEKI